MHCLFTFCSSEPYAVFQTKSEVGISQLKFTISDLQAFQTHAIPTVLLRQITDSLWSRGRWICAKFTSKDSDFEWRSSVLFLAGFRKILERSITYARGPLWRGKPVNLKLLTDYFTEAQTFWIALVFVLCDFTVYDWLLIYFLLNYCQ